MRGNYNFSSWFLIETFKKKKSLDKLLDFQIFATKPSTFGSKIFFSIVNHARFSATFRKLHGLLGKKDAV